MGCCQGSEEKRQQRRDVAYGNAANPLDGLDRTSAQRDDKDDLVAKLQEQVAQLQQQLEQIKPTPVHQGTPGSVSSAAPTLPPSPPTSQQQPSDSSTPPKGQDRAVDPTCVLFGPMQVRSPVLPSTPISQDTPIVPEGRSPTDTSSTPVPAAEAATPPPSPPPHSQPPHQKQRRESKRRQPPPPPPPPPPLVASEYSLSKPATRKTNDDPSEDADLVFKEERYVYKLPPGRTEERTKTLLVLGETGSGKSTLINAMANYACGVEYNDKVRYRVVYEQGRSQTESQTQTVETYRVYCKKYNVTLRLIDTPGFGDTRGVDRDEQITKDIYEFLLKEEEIHGVCFVAAASLPRLTMTQQYIINKVLTMFGQDARDNIFLLVTFADGKRAQVINAIQASGFPYKEENCYHFNNSALFAQGAERNEYSRNFWRMGVDSLDKFFDVLSHTMPFSLNTTRDVLQTQKKLQNYVASITPQVTIGLSKIDNLRKILEDIKVNREKINENKDYHYQETIPKVERKMKLPGTYNTQCLKCSYNCHHDCTRSNDSDKQYCCVMDAAGNCTVCPDKCHWTDHANLDYYFDWSVQLVSRVYDTKKLQLTTAKDGLSRSEVLKNTILEELQEVYNNVHDLMTSIHEAHEKLAKIALRPCNLQFVDYLNLLIEQEKLHKRPGFEGRIEQLHTMLNQAKLERDIREKKYDPVLDWKENVEKELQSIAGWEEPNEEEQDLGDTSSDDTSSTDSTISLSELEGKGGPWLHWLQPAAAVSETQYIDVDMEDGEGHHGQGGIVPRPLPSQEGLGGMVISFPEESLSTPAPPPRGPPEAPPSRDGGYTVGLTPAALARHTNTPPRGHPPPPRPPPPPQDPFSRQVWGSPTTTPHSSVWSQKLL